MDWTLPGSCWQEHLYLAWNRKSINSPTSLFTETLPQENQKLITEASKSKKELDIDVKGLLKSLVQDQGGVQVLDISDTGSGSS